jgi:hypothetical protein
MSELTHDDCAVDVPFISRANIEAIEARMKTMPQVHIPVSHDFSPGYYMRTIRIPAGTRLTGRIHLYENLNVLSEGEMSVLTEGAFKRVNAPFVVMSPPGTKRIAIAHTDCVWTTVLATPLTDPDRIEAEMTCETEQQYLAWREESLRLKGE